MIIQLKNGATKDQYNKITKDLINKGYEIKDVSSEQVIVFGVIGDTAALDERDMYAYEGVFKVTRIQTPFKKASRSFKKDDTIIDLGDNVKIGGGHFQMMAGPCSVETEPLLIETAKAVKEGGGKILRGGAFKPRTSPYSFQGHGLEGLKMLRRVADQFGLKVVSEIMASDDLLHFEIYVDIIQVGARNMQNFQLLKALGQSRKPILLKRGLSATIEEWLMSAEYIMAGGNESVILCERGIRTFEKYTRNTLDISSVLAVKELSHLPVIIDPSHAAGKYSMIEDLSLASVAVGADGLLVEIHPQPEIAYSDGAQSLKLDKYLSMMDKIHQLKALMDRIRQ
ncbi:MAG: 3-deoxy-7-phosphoheptulonate synthase [Acholeplasmataceae bacterium]